MRGTQIIHEVPTKHRAVAITFDDGPNPVYTPQVLEIFREVSGHATFFMIGEQMERSPDTVRAVAAEGHEIGNHTYTHPHLPELGTEECRSELSRTEQLVLDLTGVKPAVFRPPYLDYNEQNETVVGDFGYRAIGALNLDSRDWDMPGAEHIYMTSCRQVRNGSILIYHDGYGDRSHTVEAVRQLVRELTDEGYRLVTVSELLRLEHSQSI
ncbi:polysaccharide deacetylase family protein [Gorillibacterium sp. sgz5001074]|uniref:polysaccharide deacetylase family protein n=1 Tax=Gorillibacterium sp. sgz5001074 TaxID=3446695 RepID=UPI003F66413F